MNLYNKHRPQTFEEMIGNSVELESLQNELKKENHSHVFLFAGPQGTGKTTVARIVSYYLGANELDIREINSSNNRGIDTAREIIDQSRHLPMSGDIIAYIIDEVHKTTNDYQNAMLKILEDTPEHVYFFLCTTDPHKLIKPLRSRCTEIKFSLLTEQQIIKLLKRVSKKEEFSLSPDVAEGISGLSEGCPRKALVILGQIIGLDEDKQLEFIKSGATSEEDKEVIELCRTLLNEKSSWKEIARILKGLSISGKLDDSEGVRYAVLGYMNAVLTNGSKLPRAVSTIAAFSEPTYNTGKFGITIACLAAIS